MAYRLKQGRPPCGLELKLVDDDGKRLPHDGKTPGRLMIKGPTIARAYYRRRGRRDARQRRLLRHRRRGDHRRQGYHADHRSRQGRRSSPAASGSARSRSRTSPWAIRGGGGGRGRSASAHPKWDERPILLVQAEARRAAPKRPSLLAYPRRQDRQMVDARRRGVRRRNPTRRRRARSTSAPSARGWTDISCRSRPRADAALFLRHAGPDPASMLPRADGPRIKSGVTRNR